MLNSDYRLCLDHCTKSQNFQVNFTRNGCQQSGHEEGECKVIPSIDEHKVMRTMARLPPPPTVRTWL